MNEKGTDSLNGAVEDLLWRFGQVEFDERSWVLRIDGVEQSLEPRPLEILAYLLRHAGEVVTKEELLDVIWGRSTETISDKVLTNAVGKLRRALGDEEEAMIATVHRRGYRLVAPVSRVVLTGRAVPKLDFKPGDVVPRREQWRLVRALDISSRSEVWLAEHAKTKEHRVYKFSPDGAQLSSLKREATLSRVLRESLGERSDFVRVLEWNFEEAPYFLECEYGGDNGLLWADSQGGLLAIPLDQRLAVFVQVSEAIAASHGVGVLHKDIKPANLLLSHKDGGWQVKVADFGSGRLLEPGRLESLGITRLGFTQTHPISSDSLTGTPLYLAPELLAGQAPTQASDVYALGVLLYQLLIGDFRKPLAPGWEREIDDPLLREDIALAAAGDPLLRLESARGLAQRVACLEERHREAAEARRHEEELVATTRALQRARQRRPWIIALGLALAAGLSASLAALHQAAQARDQARRELAAAEAVNGFLQNSLLAKANPYSAGQADLSVRAAVDAAAAEVDAQFRRQPLIAAATHRSIGLAYKALTQPEPAELHLRKAISLYSAQLGEGADETLRCRIDLALEYAQASKLDAAHIEIKAVRRQTEGRRDALRAAQLYAEGNLAQYGARFKEAAGYYRESLEIAQKSSGVREETLLNTRYNLATAYARSGQLKEAEQTQRELLRLTENRYGPEHAETLDARYALVGTLVLEKRYAEALPELESTLSASERLFGPEHERTLDLLGILADCLDSMGRTDAAVLRSAERLQRIKAKIHDGPPNRILMSSLLDYGSQLRRQGQAKASVPPLKESLAVARQLYGEKHAFYQMAAFSLATSYLDLGEAPPAKSLLEAIDPVSVIEVTGWTGWDGQVFFQRGRERALAGDSAAARRLYSQALEQLSAVRAADDDDLLAARRALSD
ncbi:MAG: tetratricopeptide repeat protein [Nevskiaceae bacterium]|nr:MAG: tetratricopeptide repeat protein [Nevskiaceae bacterium]TAM31030.1 MAG: tetratricopeptide repeat protein [Nevskiaceae bacterium]